MTTCFPAELYIKRECCTSTASCDHMCVHMSAVPQAYGCPYVAVLRHLYLYVLVKCGHDNYYGPAIKNVDPYPLSFNL